MIWFLLAALLLCADLGIKYRINRHGASAVFSKVGTAFGTSPKSEKNSQSASGDTSVKDPTILGGYVTITKSHNSGAMLGLFKKWPKQLLAVSLVLLGMIGGMLVAASGKRGNILLKTGLTLLLGGAASNVCERYAKGSVTDYVRFNFGPEKFRKIVFNIGDFFIFAGAVLTAVGSCFRK